MASKLLVMGGMVVFFTFLSLRVCCPSLPSKEDPVLFYSNQKGDDLKRVFLRAIQTAKRSLILQIYGLTDPDLITALQKKGAQIFFDPSGSPGLLEKIPSAVPVRTRGLMHKKILIVDKENVFIGTANLTPTSLCMHDNVVVGFYSPPLADYLTSSQDNTFSFSSEGQTIEFWHLPDFQGQCLQNLLTLLSQAKKTIHAALFTFTHPKILQALLAAKERGVEVNIALDTYSVKGSSKKAAYSLYENGIVPYISRGKGKLLHYKWCLIDERTLILGSANWTRSAFQKNEDCLLVLHDLSPQQRNVFQKLWKDIQSNSSRMTF